MYWVTFDFCIIASVEYYQTNCIDTREIVFGLNKWFQNEFMDEDEELTAPKCRSITKSIRIVNSYLFSGLSDYHFSINLNISLNQTNKHSHIIASMALRCILYHTYLLWHKFQFVFAILVIIFWCKNRRQHNIKFWIAFKIV